MRVTINDIQRMKDKADKISMITSYDYTSAILSENAGVPVILVGDSLGQVVMGYDSTIPVTMDDMVHHTRMVSRATNESHIVGDLPFMSYQIGKEDALVNAGRLLKEGGCQSVKLEGGTSVVGVVEAIVTSGIPVMGHIGLTPQSVNQLSGYKLQGKTVGPAKKIIEDALNLENAGAYAIVLELIPRELAEHITNQLRIPTIGIGSGAMCSGQVQVFHDLIGLFPDFKPRHSRRYADLAPRIQDAIENYVRDVGSGCFPGKGESFGMDPGTLEEVLKK